MKDKKEQPVVAYLSMEIAVASDMKTYAGGLGVLAGDILRSAADLNFPMVGLTLLNRQGYFQQKITLAGQQIAKSDQNYNFSALKKLKPQVTVKIGTEQVIVGVWQYTIRSRNNFRIPIYFLDTDLPGNNKINRRLTGILYGGDEEYRLKQEIILGRAGVKMLACLGYKNIKKYHLNEGHGVLAAIELFLESPLKSDQEKVEAIRRACVFTTHTPLLKSQDVFSLPYLLEYQSDFPARFKGLVHQNEINFTRVGLYFSGYSNAVSKCHQAVTQKMFPEYKINRITNGVDSGRWIAPEFKKIYGEYLPGWCENNHLLSRASWIPTTKLWSAHQKAKRRLISHINRLSIRPQLKEGIFTIGFVRRFAPYKRPEFLFKDISRLLEVQEKAGPIQLIYAGKAHPQDLEGQALIKYIWQLQKKLATKIKIVFWEDYDMNKAQLLVAGVDLWLNTPLPPNEASGTSGMKAAHNGIPQFSTADGWWPEGYRKNKTGWLIEENYQTGKDNLYDLLEKEILPSYYRYPKKWHDMMSTIISLNASYFNTQRVLREYIRWAYK